MIKIIAGGKKHQTWVKEAIYEYEKRLKKPFNVIWELMEEEKLTLCLEKWMFSKQQCIVILDERGRNFSSVEFSEVLAGQFEAGREVIFIIGGAYGIGERVGGKADLV